LEGLNKHDYKRGNTDAQISTEQAKTEARRCPGQRRKMTDYTGDPKFEAIFTPEAEAALIALFDETEKEVASGTIPTKELPALPGETLGQWLLRAARASKEAPIDD
jgi:hypothetical protein